MRASLRLSAPGAACSSSWPLSTLSRSYAGQTQCTPFTLNADTCTLQPHTRSARGPQTRRSDSFFSENESSSTSKV